LAALCALLLMLVTATGLWGLSRARCFALVGPAVCRLETQRPLVALTFDDGPSRLGVETILPELERHGAHATFFLIGREIREEPELARRILASDHELGNHSFSHVRMVGRRPAFYAEEIEKTQRELRSVGADATTFRPPYGKKLLGLPLALRRSGLTMIMWDVEDPQTSDPAKFADEVVQAAHPGSIILLHAMHPANRTAREALPAILDGLQAKGYRVVSVRELLGAG
jgi:peptidoglycan/xylan/chitin deacetylase (PgdA/CDA1 family)